MTRLASGKDDWLIRLTRHSDLSNLNQSHISLSVNVCYLWPKGRTFLKHCEFSRPAQGLYLLKLLDPSAADRLWMLGGTVTRGSNQRQHVDCVTS